MKDRSARYRSRVAQIDLSAPKSVARSLLGPGVVVWAYVSFEDDDGWKSRPAVIIAVVGRLVTILPGSSAESRKRYPARYIEIQNPSAAGLRRPTGLRRAPITVDIADVIDIVGSLDDEDMHVLRTGVMASVDGLAVAN